MRGGSAVGWIDTLTFLHVLLSGYFADELSQVGKSVTWHDVLMLVLQRSHLWPALFMTMAGVIVRVLQERKVTRLQQAREVGLPVVVPNILQSET